MAEALSLASPHGPSGFRCIDEDCEMHKIPIPMVPTKPGNRWSLKVQEDLGRARLVFSDGPNVIGVMVMPWSDYAALTRIISSALLRICREVLERAFHNRLYKDAITKFDNSPELAQIKLLEFGWDNEKILSYADDFSKQIVKQVVDHMPEHE